jgi:predicted DsbA family dithiol-disulfide isomerase
MVARLLNENSHMEPIKERDEHSQKMGVTAVSTFIIANQNVVSGSQT